MTIVWTSGRKIISRATTVQNAVLRNHADYRYTCRQIKQCLWPAARAWHALTGWPQARVEMPSEPALLHMAVSALLQSASGALAASVGCLFGRLPKAREALPGRDAGEALGELLATPIYAVIDLVGIAGATILSVLSVILDTCGASIGTLVGTLTAPWVALHACRAAT